MSIVGSTATLLFHKTSDLDLFFLPQDTQARSHHALPEVPPEESNTLVEERAKVLKSLIPFLKEETSEQQEEEDENVKNLFWKVRLVNKKSFPVSITLLLVSPYPRVYIFTTTCGKYDVGDLTYAVALVYVVHM